VSHGERIAMGWSVLLALILLATLAFAAIRADRDDCGCMDEAWLRDQERRKGRLGPGTRGKLQPRDSWRAEAANHPSVWRSDGDDAA
jgi:hypothetical protein